MASDGEDDYLSDKFLLESVAITDTAKKPLTYAERRKEAQRQSDIKNAQNRVKKRREREAEALEEGLRQSLFERAEAEEQELGAKNKAMSMMLRMGFKPGESLGRNDADGPEAGPSTVIPALPRQESTPPASVTPEAPPLVTDGQSSEPRHRTAPLPVDPWSGKKGVGLGKRAPSPGVAERASKVARVDEETKRETYRSRTREAFEDRRVLGQLIAASRTLIDLDEKAGIQFNILSLNPQEPETFPAGFLEALSTSFDDAQSIPISLGDSESERLRKQMQLDALVPLETISPIGSNGEDVGVESKKDTPLPLSLSDETIDDAREFLQMSARDRLDRVLRYLRKKYYYCFWCGTRYSDEADLDGNCPGEDEDAH